MRMERIADCQNQDGEEILWNPAGATVRWAAIEGPEDRRRFRQVRKYNSSKKSYCSVYMEDPVGNLFELFGRSHETMDSAGTNV